MNTDSQPSDQGVGHTEFREPLRSSDGVKQYLSRNRASELFESAGHN